MNFSIRTNLSGGGMGAGIRIDGGSDISIIDCKFDNFDIGVSAKDVKNLLLEGSDFNACRTAVEADGIDGLIARKNTNNANHSIRETKGKSFPVTKYGNDTRKILSAEALRFCINRLRESSD
ncbi:hypothetical protein [Janthinobacterium kumbetense]|uniref:Uncharacterized protein n=1 Tax=Janthinobacterium kumbetense TaxID=2950280 RepID=A0ABT0WNK9_9BURK|nr:hypothetical protein [Janthinobacterium kumbetense]MCM2564466.1 hypothetical protein [Janthinobacterium kumbetense]